MSKKLISLLITISVVASHMVAFAQAQTPSLQETTASETEQIQNESKPEKEILSQEDFSKGLKDWEVISGSGYSVKNGTLVFKNTKSAEKTSTLLSKTISVENADIEFDLKLESGIYFGIVFRVQNDKTMYVLKFYKNQGKAVLLKKVDSGELVQVESVDARVKSDEFSRVGIRLAGDNIIVRVDEGNIMNIKDASIKEGVIGFDGYSAKAVVDNLEVFRYDGVEYDIEVVDKTQKAPVKEIYVAPDGTPGDGSKERPIVGIQRAIEVARQLKRGNNAINVIFTEGRYEIEEPIEFTSVDSGTEYAPVTYKAQEGADVVFTGAKQLKTSKFVPVTDPKIISRLHNNAKGKVLQMKFTKAEIPDAIKNFADSHREGTAWYADLPQPRIYLNGETQSLAKWPNGDFEYIEDSTPGGIKANNVGSFADGGAIHFTNTEPIRWTTAEDAFIMGQLGVYWASEAIPIKEIDLEENKIWADYWSYQGIQKDHRYYIINLLEEIDIPGEYYIDPVNSILYLYPSQELNEDATLEIAVLRDHMIKFIGAEHINFEGIRVTKTAQPDDVYSVNKTGTSGIFLEKSKHIKIKDCIIDNISYHGIHMWSGTDVTIEGNIIDDCGHTGIFVKEAGVRATLTPSNLVIQNNILSAAQIFTAMMDNAGIKLYSTVDAVVQNNIFHNMLNSAISYSGNGNIIQRNEISSCVHSSADAGATYIGRTFVDHGNVLNQNYLHDIGMKYSESEHPSIGIYWDDEITGQIATQNIIVMNGYDNKANMHISGFDHLVKGNTLVNSDKGFMYSQRTHTTVDWAERAASRQKWNTLPVTSDLFVEKYPVMAKTVDKVVNEWENFLRLDSDLIGNLLVHVERESFHANVYNYSTIEDHVHIKEDIENEIFVDPKNHDYRVKDEAREKYNISKEVLGEEFDMNLIGLQNGKKLPEERKHFRMLAPENKTVGIETKDVCLAWTRADSADEYTCQVATDPDFNNIVYEESTVYRAVYPEGLENNKTYYWRVAARNLSKQIGFENDAQDGVWSFTTAPQDTLITTLIEKKIEVAEQKLKTIKEGPVMDQYESGTKDKIKVKIKQAQKFIEEGKGTQKDVEAVAEDMNTFLMGLDQYINVGYVTLDVESSDFVDHYADSQISKDGNTVTSQGASKATMFVMDKILSNAAVVKFKMKIDDIHGWFAFGLRGSSTDKVIWNQPSYYIIVKPHIFELQKQGSIQKTAPHRGQFKTGEWNDVEIAAITTIKGVHVFLKLNDEVIFDFLDTTTPNYEPGRFIAYVPKGMVMTLADADEVPTGLFERSDEIQAQLSEGIVTLDVNSTTYAETGEWKVNSTIKGDKGTDVRTSSETGATATWTMIGDRAELGKVFKVSYYHVPSADGDKNVKVKVGNYRGLYETTIDLSKGEEGWVDLGTVMFINASNVTEGSVSFEGSGNGSVNVNRVRFGVVEGAVDMSAQK